MSNQECIQIALSKRSLQAPLAARVIHGTSVARSSSRFSVLSDTNHNKNRRLLDRFFEKAGGYGSFNLALCLNDAWSDEENQLLI